MRSITVKLLLAFLAISMLSVVLLVLSVRWMTEREFRSYLFDQSRTSVTFALEDYYRKTGTWVGVENGLLVTGELPPPRGIEGGRWFFTLVDNNNHVVLAGSGDQIGELLPQADIESGLPIKVSGSTVGIMVTRQPSVRVNPAETAFLDRIKQIYFLSAIGVIALALLLAFLLSHTLTRPIRELIVATRAISAGELKQSVPVRSRDELGELAASFNQMNAELVRSLNLRRQMTADIAHELRTPISVILGHAEAVHDGVLPPSQEVFDIIRDEATRLESLVEDLRTLTLADAGELRLNPQAIDPQKFLEDVRTVHLIGASQKGISLELKDASGLPEVEIDTGKMMQVLSNLLDNALRYTPKGGHITLSAQQVEGAIEIRVADSGPGLEPEELAHIFDRFYRANDSRQREEGGSGLGLAISKSILEAHGGRIRAESVKGQGLTVIISLPI